jgi:transcriptional regulator with XRE-family HTH domain
MQRFAEKLRTLRLQHKLTQQQVADALGVGQAFVHRMENGQKKPNVEHIIKLSHLFGVTTDALILDEHELE